jgi:hypothetical protein
MFHHVIRHLTGLRAAATVLAGLSLIAGGAWLLSNAASLREGWAFLGLAGLSCVLAGLLFTTLPICLTTRMADEGVSLGWALGRRRISWAEVRRIVIGPLGSGGERDPIAVTLLLSDGVEVLFCLLGKSLLRDHVAAQTLLRAAESRGVPVEDATATPEERKGWNRSNPETFSELRYGLGVDLHDEPLACCLFGHLLEFRRHHAAGTAPGGPEVDDHRQRGPGDERIKCRSVKHLDRFGRRGKRHVTVSTSRTRAQRRVPDAVCLTARRARY